jgi:hypothetical protein
MVSRSTHQTVRLSAGPHRSPEDGACVVELASMLNDEPFSDRPSSVCPALREFLHSYNDDLPDHLRQELYGLASEIVGTRSPAPVTAWRARLCIDWARSLAPLEDVPTRFREWTLTNCSLAGEYAALAARRDAWCHRQTVAFFRWLAHARAPAALPTHVAATVPVVPELRVNRAPNRRLRHAAIIDA